MKAKRTARSLLRVLLIAVAWFGGAAHAEEASVTQAADQASVAWVACGGAWPEQGCEAALVWGDWEKGTSGFWVRAPKGHTFARHAHPTPERILLVRGRMTGAVDGGRETTLMPGMYWGVGADAVHWARCEEACLMYITYDLPYGLRFP